MTTEQWEYVQYVRVMSTVWAGIALALVAVALPTLIVALCRGGRDNASEAWIPVAIISFSVTVMGGAACVATTTQSIQAWMAPSSVVPEKLK